ncbi:MAG TPA: glycosyltransferase [Pyrinomonadaceae bacterium]|nr:glycosyltransferase [Pyrinomonadaceae bacterium]
MNLPLPQSKASSAVMSLWLKERVYSSRALQYPYLSWMDMQSRLALLRSQPHEASRRMLHIWRHLGAEGLGEKRVARLLRIIQQNCYQDGQLLSADQNRLRLEFIQSTPAQELRSLYASFPLEHRLRLRFPNDEDPERQGNLVILKKHDETTGERGVLLLMYSEAVLAMAAIYDLSALASKYMFVLEPSSWGYQDVRFLFYLGSDLDVLIQSPRRADFEFVENLKTNLVPVSVGAGEWVDPEVFQPRAEGKAATYDVVMVSAWDPLKRHEVFFKVAAERKSKGERPLKFALIGYKMGWTREPVEQLLKKYGLESDCDIYEMIPHAQVAQIVADSKMSLLLSRREGANRGIYESMFCNTPIIVYRNQCGVNLDHVNSQTGLLADDHELGAAIDHVLNHPYEFDPRGWALANAGYGNATKTINTNLREMSNRRGLPWTRDIVAKKSAPELRYAKPDDYKLFDDEYRRLERHLLPVS